MTKYLSKNIIYLEHYQNHEQNRSGYLKGLAIDCYINSDNDRNSHYAGRELFWSNRPKSALKEFDRHIKMNRWAAEKSQSMIFSGDCLMQLGQTEEALQMYHKAFLTESNRREPLIRLAEYFYKVKDEQKVICYCNAMLDIPKNNFYSNFQNYYENYPHEMLYWAYWNIGNIEKSKEHFDKAFAYQPLNPKYLHDWRFYYKTPMISVIVPTLGRPDKLQRLLDKIKENANYPDYEIIVKQDSFENRKGVPILLKEGVAESKGDLVMFLANDCIPEPNFMIQAVIKMYQAFGKNYDGLCGLNDGYWRGEFATHFLVSKKLL